MSDVALELESGKTATFKTAGKVCKDNIVVTATGGGDNADYIALLDRTMTDFIAPAEVTSLGSSVFYNNRTLNSADLRSVTNQLGDNVFFGCSALKSVQMPIYIQSIMPFAFQDSGLTELEYFGANSAAGQQMQAMFSRCYSLKKNKYAKRNIRGNTPIC